MMNGLQSLPQWESAFNNPSGSKLGLLNAIQASFFCTCVGDLY
jgi:DNA-binding transcriptional regulator YiaG